MEIYLFLLFALQTLLGLAFIKARTLVLFLEKRESALSLREAGSLLCLPESRSVHRRRVRNR